MSIKCIIFDYDGVIVDSFDEMHAVYRIFCKRFGYDCPTNREVFRKMYGNDFKSLYIALGIPENLWEKGSEIYYDEIIKRDSQPFSLIKKQLDILSKKYKLFVVSATSREEVESKLKHHYLSRYFKKVYATNNYKENFSKVDKINHILKAEGVSVDEVIHIGDRNKDYAKSVEAGLQHTIIVDYGWGNSITEGQAIKVKKQEDLLDAIDRCN